MSEDQDWSGNRETRLKERGRAPPSRRKFNPPKETAWAAGPTLKPECLGAALPSIWESHSTLFLHTGFLCSSLMRAGLGAWAEILRHQHPWAGDATAWTGMFL